MNRWLVFYSFLRDRTATAARGERHADVVVIDFGSNPASGPFGTSHQVEDAIAEYVGENQVRINGMVRDTGAEVFADDAVIDPSDIHVIELDTTR